MKDPLIELFLADLSARVPALDGAVQAIIAGSDQEHAFELLAENSHDLRGGARLVGLHVLASMITAMEQYALSKKAPTANIAEALTGAVVQLQEALDVPADKMGEWAEGKLFGLRGICEALGGTVDIPEKVAPIELLEVPVTIPVVEEAEGPDSIEALFESDRDALLPRIKSALASIEAREDLEQAFQDLADSCHTLRGGAALLTWPKLAGALGDIERLALSRAQLTSEQVESVRAVVTGLEAEELEDASFKPVSVAVDAVAQPVKESEPAPQPVSEGIDASMMDLFCVELETHVASLNSGVLALEKNPKNAEVLEGLMRAAHSIKGAARVVNIDLASDLAHVLEDCFVAAQEGALEFKASDVDLLFLGIDILNRLSQLKADEILSWLEERRDALEGMLPLLKELSKGKELCPDTESLRSSLGLTTIEGEELAEEAAEPESSQSVMEDRVLRVSASNLNELMGLAGESLVESRWLQPFSDSLLQLKMEHNCIAAAIDDIREELGGHCGNARASELIVQLQRSNNTCRAQINDRMGDLDTFIRRHSSLSDRLYREVIATRMRPFIDGVAGFPRLVRDISRSLQKKVELEIRGENTPVDRDIIEKLEAPFNHMIRNAIDHGLETPEDRKKAGKSEIGKIVLEARHRAGMLSITLQDDGKGIDIESVRRAVVRRKLMKESLAENLSEPELMEFLFLPGFSTSEKVTMVSGRGVGLDVVQAVIQDVGGRVRIETKPGKGLTYHMQLPLTLSVIRALLVEIASEPYAFPLSRIDRVLMVSLSDIEVVENRQFINFEGENIGLVQAHQVLNLEPCDKELDLFPVIVLSDRMSTYGLAVDSFLGERELVVQELAQHIGNIPNIGSGALMEDGTPLLIVDVEDLVRSMDKLLHDQKLRKIGECDPSKQVGAKKRILVVEDSITVREVECRLLINAGYDVDSAVDGRDGWNAACSNDYDLIITDIDMPRLNGFELITMIRADEHLKDLPIMIVSYKDRECDRQKGMEVGANYYFTKSTFHDESMLSAVHDMIGEP